MLRAVLRLLIACLSLVVSLTALTHQAGACSGGGPPPNQLVPTVLEAEFIVDGRVKWTDETRYNAIISVKRYLNGASGPDEIIVSTIDARSIAYRSERQLYMSCNFGYVSRRPMTAGENVIMFLARSTDGTYSFTKHLFTENVYASFPTPESKIGVGYALSDSGTDYQVTRLNRRQLIELIQSIPGMTTVKPTREEAPLHAPLMVTTAAGHTYHIPIDGGPIEDITDSWYLGGLSCWVPGCIAGSPEGFEHHRVGGEGAFPLSYDTQSNPPVISDGIAFSPMGDAFALWDEYDSGVKLYVQVLPVITAIPFDIDVRHPDPVTTELEFDMPLSMLSDFGAWSPDGRVLAFVDSRGLWFWDVFTSGAEPELSPYSGTTAVHGYSWTGRYLSITDHSGRHYIDLVSGESYPDGAWGPDDRALLVYAKPPTLIYTVPRREVALKLLPEFAAVRYAEWTREWAFVALACNDHGGCSIFDTAIQSHHHTNDRNNPVPYIGSAFDFSEDTGNLAVVNDGYLLTIRDAAAGEHREIDLRGQLDSEIVSIKWMPSVFYDAHYNGTAW